MRVVCYLVFRVSLPPVKTGATESPNTKYVGLSKVLHILCYLCPGFRTRFADRGAAARRFSGTLCMSMGIESSTSGCGGIQ